MVKDETVQHETGAFRNIIFTSEVQLRMMMTSPVLFMDGTFKSVPKNFEQVYIVTGAYRGENFPLAFCIMTKRTSAAYRDFLRTLKLKAQELAPNGLSPERIISDFEPAVMGPIAEFFPRSVHSGCWFHYCQALRRFVQTNQLLREFEEHENFRTNFYLKLCLPMLPSDKIIDANEIIDANFQAPQRFREYFESYWEPKATQISTFDFIETRTNNASEGYNSQFNKNVNFSKSNFWAFINKLRGEESYALFRKIKLDQGNPPIAMKLKYITRNNNLLQWKNDFEAEQNHDLLFKLQKVNHIIRN